MSGKQYGAYARVPLCRACGNPFVPPGHGGCCSVRCTQYLEVARQPVLGDPIFCQRDEPILCWGCQVSFRSSGIRLCPECYFERSDVRPVPPAAPVEPAPSRHDAPIIEATPAHTAPGQPRQAGPDIRISQAAVNALSEAQYQELRGNWPPARALELR